MDWTIFKKAYETLSGIFDSFIEMLANLADRFGWN